MDVRGFKPGSAGSPSRYVLSWEEVYSTAVFNSLTTLLGSDSSSLAVLVSLCWDFQRGEPSGLLGMLCCLNDCISFAPYNEPQHFRLSICGQFGINGQGMWRPLPAQEQVLRLPEVLAIDKNGKPFNPTRTLSRV